MKISHAPHALVMTLVLALVSTAACKKKETATDAGANLKVVTDYEKKAVANIEEKLQFIQGLRGKLAPPTTKDGVVLDKDWANYAWVHDTDLADLAATPKGSRLKDSDKLRACAKEARTPDFGKHTLDRLQNCESLRYVFVARTLNRVEPKVVSKAAGMENAKFEGCTAEGDVLVYDLNAKKHLGGFRWKATCDKSVFGEALTKNFEDNILEAIEAGHRKFITH